MIYSQSFGTLNPAARDRVLRQLYGTLQDRPAGAAAINIAAATKTDLPAYWKPISE